MSQPNIGARHFAARERISQVLKGISGLARNTSTDLGDSISDAAIDSSLKAPFLFMVCGEVNAGKSTLINGLLGSELCKVSVLPETNKVIRYRYGATSHETAISPCFEERYRPIQFLKDFNLIDAPGTNSSVDWQEETIRRFLPTLDLILFVFPVANPWGAATWNMISGLPKDSLSKIVFIIQQADQREDADIRVITEHMSDLSMQRIGIVPQIFAVSGKTAFEAKSAGDYSGQRLRQSGYPELEAYINLRICESPERQAALAAWRGTAYSALRKIEDHIDDQSRELIGQNRFLTSIEDEIDAMRERLVSRLPQHLSGVAEIFDTEAVWVTRSLRKWLGITRSFFRIFFGDRTGSNTEALFISRLRGAVEAVAESDGADIVDACRSHWQDLDARVRESIGTGIGEQEPVEEKLSEARHRFVQRIGRAAHQAIGNLHLRKELERELRRRNIALKSFTTTALLFLIFGSLCGIFMVPWLPWIFCGIAVSFMLGGAIIAFITGHRISRDFRKSLLNTCGIFADTLRTDYEDALRVFFQDYTACLGSIRKHLASQKIAIEPKLARWNELFLTLKSIEQDG